ncbi:hypothetical protein AJ80_10003 [Polytolypa hystricis UAMH7299]|uniref:Uncharacterized protein n=1 Tax=Polytolypa hystricis (strain UAMH7299) TaxID=1447883 RepID=A0A2B7WEV1_POLH7|nr:hypothetical protein AJ80_10003 [Polytolypa hystricis UAMH7299]
MTWRTYARKHTGISESSHFADNEFIGRKQTLLAAVLNSRRYVADLLAKDTLSARGIPSRWRNRSNIVRIAQLIRRRDTKNRTNAQRREEQPGRPFNISNPYDQLMLDTTSLQLQSNDNNAQAGGEDDEERMGLEELFREERLGINQPIISDGESMLRPSKRKNKEDSFPLEVPNMKD